MNFCGLNCLELPTVVASEASVTKAIMSQTNFGGFPRGKTQGVLCSGSTTVAAVSAMCAKTACFFFLCYYFIHLSWVFFNMTRCGCRKTPQF
jgi:hypothetical protein